MFSVAAKKNTVRRRRLYHLPPTFNTMSSPPAKDSDLSIEKPPVPALSPALLLDSNKQSWVPTFLDGSLGLSQTNAFGLTTESSPSATTNSWAMGMGSLGPFVSSLTSASGAPLLDESKKPSASSSPFVDGAELISNKATGTITNAPTSGPLRTPLQTFMKSSRESAHGMPMSQACGMEASSANYVPSAAGHSTTSKRILSAESQRDGNATVSAVLAPPERKVTRRTMGSTTAKQPRQNTTDKSQTTESTNSSKNATVVTSDGTTTSSALVWEGGDLEVAVAAMVVGRVACWDELKTALDADIFLRESYSSETSTTSPSVAGTVDPFYMTVVSDPTNSSTVAGNGSFKVDSPGKTESAIDPLREGQDWDESWCVFRIAELEANGDVLEALSENHPE